MRQQRSLSKLLEFDIAIFLFAVFQLALTNLIVFKLNFKHMDSDLIIFSVIMLSRRILCKTNHFYQVNIYRINLLFFTVLRTVPFTIFIVLVTLLFKIAFFNSVTNFVCVMLP